MLFINIILIALSLFVLIWASNFILKSAINIANRLKISQLIIGSTIVALGTIIPSVAVNIAILANGNSGVDIALGNMIGTNYVNLGLALGIPAFVTTIVTKYNVFEKELPLYLAVVGLLTTFIVDKEINFFEGALFILIYIGITIVIYQYSRREGKELNPLEKIAPEQEITTTPTSTMAKDFSILLIGMIILAAASWLLSYTAPIIAKQLNINEYLLGLTFIGVGTSLPTIVAGINAAKKGYIDIVLGNVFGGNIINICLGIGIPALFKNLPLNEGSVSDIYFTNIYNIIILLLILIEMKLIGKNKTLSRISGIVIITIYLSYIIFNIIKYT